MTAVLVTAVARPATAQHVFEVSGGGSALYDAYGGAVNFWGPRHDGWIGIGYADGLRVGAFARGYVGRDTLRAGNDVLRVGIPTDLFTGSPAILFQGVGYAAARGDTRIQGHAGASAIGLNSPFFAAARGSYPLAYLAIADSVLQRGELSLTAIGASRQSVLGGFTYTTADSIHGAIGGGVGANRPYAAVSGTIDRRRFRVRGSYAYRAPGFRRAEASMPNQVETERENVEILFKPSRTFQFGIERKHYVQDSLGSAVPMRSTGNAAFVMAHVHGIRLNGGVYLAETDGAGRSVNTYAAVGRQLTSWLDVDGYHLRSAPEGQPATQSLIGHFREQVTNRLRLVQQVTYDGRTTRTSLTPALP